MYRDEVKKHRPYVWKNQLLPHQKYTLMRVRGEGGHKEGGGEGGMGEGRTEGERGGRGSGLVRKYEGEWQGTRGHMACNLKLSCLPPTTDDANY